MSTTTEHARIEQLEQRVSELKANVAEKEQRIEQLKQQTEELTEVRQENQQLHETVEEQGDRIDELEAELQEYREHNEKDKAAVKRRITELESDSAENEECADTHDATAAEDGPRQGETPLAQTVKLPEPVAQQELTANQERARFVATDVLDYATKAPAGFVITSSDIRTILAAKEDGPPHTETVSRVITFLDQFGQADVEVVKRRGIRRVVFTEGAANRYHHAGTRDQEDITGVVMGRATG